MVPVTTLLGPPPSAGQGLFLLKAAGNVGLGSGLPSPFQGGPGRELSPGLASALTQWFSTQESTPSRGLGTLRDRDSFGCYTLGGALDI